MSHKDEPIICPNCGHHASGNYCSQCGQETHLHNDSFFGLILHFIGHYFHYDSKFWKTMAALVARPGKLTVAYWNKQRMRYIPPVSLYLFISVVFFLVYTALPSKQAENVKFIAKNTDSVLANAEAEAPIAGKSIIHSMRQKIDKIDTTGKNDSVNKAEQAMADVMVRNMERDKKEMKEKVIHMLPKVFFFLIPLMGLVLLLLFMRRKELNYVSHVIFALHYHTFWFTVMLLKQLYRFHKGQEVVAVIAALLSIVYFVIALKKTYGIGWLKSFGYSVIVAAVYILFFFLAFFAAIMIVALPYMRAVKGGALHT